MSTSDRKVTVEIVGGLGNQMFCYAAGYSYASKNNAFLKLDLSFFGDNALYGRDYRLDYYSVDESVFSSIIFRIRFFRNIKYFLTKIFKFKGSIIESDASKLDQLFFEKMRCKNINLYGYWQNERYFFDYKNEIIEQLTLKSFHSKKKLNHKVLSSIRASNSVCIHYRSYGEVEVKEGDRKAMTVGMSYYRDCINQVKAKNKMVEFYLFGDVLNDEIEVLLGDSKFTRVDWNNATGDEVNDMYLMSQCKYLVLANSSFSWWAGWLSDSANVFFPTRNDLVYYPTPPSSWNVVSWTN